MDQRSIFKRSKRKKKKRFKIAISKIYLKKL